MKEKRHGHPRFYEIIEEMAQLHSDKNHDYAEEGRPLGNFERVAEIIDKYNLLEAPVDTKVKVSIFYMLKQFDCFLNALGTGKEMKVEGLSERLRDIVVYGVLTEILLEEKYIDVKDFEVQNFIYNFINKGKEKKKVSKKK